MDIDRKDYGVEFYDLLNTMHWKKIESDLQDILCLLNENGTYLDIGAGTGNLSIFLANKLVGSNIVAIEPSRKMRIAFTAKIFNHKNLNKKISIIPAQIGNYIIDSSIDGCFIIDTIGHISKSNRIKLWKDLSQNLKKNGLLIITNLPKAYYDFPVGLIAQSKLGNNIVKSYITERSIDQEDILNMNFKTDVADKNGNFIYSERYRISWRIIDSKEIISEICNFSFEVKGLKKDLIIFIKS